ncbi:MAG: hypothetical protein HY579_05775 [Nitrospinae bacterium]|nr:hypothetical protein [Nitrospinota bacterium]
MTPVQKPQIEDTGKVWIRGRTRPSFAVRVDEKFFVPGMEEGQTIEYWTEGNCLCVVLSGPAPGTRTARRFGLDLPAVAPAALFSGFEKTRHRDVTAVLWSDPGVEESVMAPPA